MTSTAVSSCEEDDDSTLEREECHKEEETQAEDNAVCPEESLSRITAEFKTASGNESDEAGAFAMTSPVFSSCEENSASENESIGKESPPRFSPVFSSQDTNIISVMINSEELPPRISPIYSSEETEENILQGGKYQGNEHHPEEDSLFPEQPISAIAREPMTFAGALKSEHGKRKRKLETEVSGKLNKAAKSDSALTSSEDD